MPTAVCGSARAQNKGAADDPWIIRGEERSLDVATAAEVCALAFQHHQAGNLPLAERLYVQVLEADPNNADAHHLLGVLAYQLGHFDRAVTAIRQATRLNPQAAMYHSNLGLGQDALGLLDEAVASYLEALRLQP